MIILFTGTVETQSEVISDLKLAADRIFDLIYNHAMKTNQNERHFLSSLDLDTSLSLENYVIKNTK